MFVILGQSEVPVIVPQAGALAIIVSILYLLWRIQRRDRRWQEAMIKKLDTDNRRCEWRLNFVLGKMRREGIDIPDELWGPAPWERQDIDDAVQKPPLRLIPWPRSETG